jgi:hypothetical protein
MAAKINDDRLSIAGMPIGDSKRNQSMNFGACSKAIAQARSVTTYGFSDRMLQPSSDPR